MNPASLLVFALGLTLAQFHCGKPREVRELAYAGAGGAFSVTYPEPWKPEKPRYPNEVFRVTEPPALPSLAISVYEQSDPRIIDEHYADKFIGSLKALFPRAGGYKLVSSKLISLPDGTPAAELICEWTWEDGATGLASANVSAVKDQRLVSVTCTGMQATPAEVLAKYPRTLKFAR